MKTKPIAFFLIIFSTVFTSVGQIYYKLGLVGVNTFWTYLNFTLIFGLLLNVVAGFLGLFAYKHGQFSTVYPFMALNFVWVSILSLAFISGEMMGPLKWAGVILISLGVAFISLSEKKNINRIMKTKTIGDTS